MNEYEWNTYKDKNTNKCIMACKYSGFNKDNILAEFARRNVMQDSQFSLLDLSIGDYVCYKTQGDPYAFAVNKTVFNERYEVI